MYIFNEFSNVGYLVLRLVVAVIFIYHAWPKLKSPEAMASVMPAKYVRVLGLVELLAGLAIGLGVFMSWAALAIVVVMIGAIYYKVAKWKVPFWSHTSTGWEFDLILLAVGLFLLTNAY